MSELRFCPECDEWKIPASIRPTIAGDYVRCAECMKRELAHRSCGECQACCTILKVDEINKPVDTPCEHLCGGKCGVYDQRPGTCESFECMWLHGQGFPIMEAEALRPDRCGAVFYPEPGDAIGEFMVMTCQLRTKQDLKHPLVREAIDKFLARGLHVAVVAGTDSYLINPKGEVVQ